MWWQQIWLSMLCCCCCCCCCWKIPPHKNDRMKNTPGKGCTIYEVGVSVGGWSPWGQWWEGPGRPRYGQHCLHQLKPLLIHLPQHQPFILCNEYPLIFGVLENSLKQQHNKRNSFSFHDSLLESNESGQRALSVGLSGRRPNYDTDTDSTVQITIDRTNMDILSVQWHTQLIIHCHIGYSLQ